MIVSKEKKREYNKRYREKNKEKEKERSKKYNKKYREKNKERFNKIRMEYYRTPEGKKSNTINSWKAQGMLCEDFDSLYEIYFHTWKCDFCNCIINKKINKHLDHNHENGEIRGILCRGCNSKDVYE